MQDMQDTQVWFLDWKSSQEGNGNPLSILAWEIPWTEEPGRLQSMELQKLEMT